MRAGGWQETVGTDLAGARLVVVGLGGKGSQVLRIGLAFGMDVVAWSQNLTDERAAEVGVRRVKRGELFTMSDFVTVHLLLSKRTRGLIGADDLALKRHTAVLINTSRGPIVEQQALLDALDQGPGRSCREPEARTQPGSQGWKKYALPSNTETCT